MADETTELLIRARGLVERGWCRCVTARNAKLDSVPPTSPDAVAWCTSGALEAADPTLSNFSKAEGRLLSAMGDPETTATFNDLQETVEPVLAAFDRAIAAGGR